MQGGTRATAALYKVGEVYPGAKLAVCEAADIPSRPIAAVGTLGARGYTQPADQVQSETPNRRFEGGQGGKNRARHHERGYPLEPVLLGTPHSPTNPCELRVR